MKVQTIDAYLDELTKMAFKTITVHYPLPSKVRHVGGRLQRKSRLKKKQQKYRLAKGYSFKCTGYVDECRTVETDGKMFREVTLKVNQSK